MASHPDPAAVLDPTAPATRARAVGATGGGHPLARELALAGAGALLAGVLGYLGTGLHPVAALAWLIPLPVLAVAARVRCSLALGAAAVGWIAAQTNLWSYFAGPLEMPPPVLVGVLAVYPLLAVAGTALFRALLARGRPVLAALAYPAVWAAGEYAVSVPLPDP